MSTGKRRRKKFLAPQEKYEIWMQLLRSETTINEAAVAAGVDRSTVDRSTVAKIRPVARQRALDVLAASRPGRREKQRDLELETARSEIDRLQKAMAEMAVRLMLAEGKEPWG